MNQYLKIAPNLTLPIDAVTQTFAILAIKRAGKSYCARRFAEQFHKAGQQIVIVDPKGDWWGIRGSADGKNPGLPVVIIGGERGDVPLEPGSGEVVAKLVVEDRVSVLLDLSLLRKHQVTTFMTGFLETVYRLKAREIYRTPMMMIVDEADAIAPQRPQDGEQRMLGAAEDIVRRGGQRGIGCMMVSQRSAVLNKNVLTQCEVLVALRTIGTQDLDALNEWVRKHGTPERNKVLMESLPSLPTGDAWFWSPLWPGEGIFQRVHVLPIETFDSGATPKVGERRVEPKNLADVDLAALTKQMAATIEKAKADDPKELKKKISELQFELEKALQKKGSPVLDRAAIEKARVIGAEQERDTARVWVQGAINQIVAAQEQLDKLHRFMLDSSEGFSRPIKEDFDVDYWIKQDDRPIEELMRALEPAEFNPSRALPASNGTMSSGSPRQKVLTALAQYPNGLSLKRLAILAGYTVNGHFTNTISSLRADELITPARVTPLQITEKGKHVLGPFEKLPSGEALRRWWLDRLSEPEAKVLGVLFRSYPNSLDLNELARLTGYTVNGHFTNTISSLRKKGLMTPARTPMKAAEELYA